MHDCQHNSISNSSEPAIAHCRGKCRLPYIPPATGSRQSIASSMRCRKSVCPSEHGAMGEAKREPCSTYQWQTTRIEYPAFNSRGTICEPINPAPPVTKIHLPLTEIGTSDIDVIGRLLDVFSATDQLSVTYSFLPLKYTHKREVFYHRKS